jgi:hypothetical protein
MKFQLCETVETLFATGQVVLRCVSKKKIREIAATHTHTQLELHFSLRLPLRPITLSAVHESSVPCLPASPETHTAFCPKLLFTRDYPNSTATTAKFHTEISDSTVYFIVKPPKMDSQQPQTQLLVTSSQAPSAAPASDDQLRCSESVASSVLQDLSFGLNFRRESSDDSATSTPITSANASPAVHAQHHVKGVERLQLNQQQQQHGAVVQKMDEDSPMTEGTEVTKQEDHQMTGDRGDFDANSWELLINRLPAAVVRRLLLTTIQEHEGVRTTVHNQMLQEVNLWRDARLARLMNRLKRSVLKLEIAGFYDRLVKVTSIASDCWEEQHAIILEFCKTMESYVFGAYEVGCDFRKHYPLCIEIFYMVIEGANKLSQINTQFDISETLSDWTPSTRHVPESFTKAKGFVSCVLRLWSHVLHVASVDQEAQQNPTKIHKLFVWTVMHDPQQQLASHLMQFEGQNAQTKNIALEVYQHFAALKSLES